MKCQSVEFALAGRVIVFGRVDFGVEGKEFGVDFLDCAARNKRNTCDGSIEVHGVDRVTGNGTIGASWECQSD